MGIADRRLQYETAGLDIDDLLADPIAQLQQWYHQAEEAGAAEPNAMVVSTVDAEGQPDARVVLARNIDATGVHSLPIAQVPRVGRLVLRHEVPQRLLGLNCIVKFAFVVSSPLHLMLRAMSISLLVRARLN